MAWFPGPGRAGHQLASCGQLPCPSRRDFQLTARRTEIGLQGGTHHFALQGTANRDRQRRPTTLHPQGLRKPHGEEAACRGTAACLQCERTGREQRHPGDEPFVNPRSFVGPDFPHWRPAGTDLPGQRSLQSRRTWRPLRCAETRRAPGADAEHCPALGDQHAETGRHAREPVGQRQGHARRPNRRAPRVKVRQR